MMDDMELDYKKMFEELQRVFKTKLDQETLYFELLAKVNELNDYGKIISESIQKLSIADQIKCLKAIINYQQICKTMVDKYSLEGGDLMYD